MEGYVKICLIGSSGLIGGAFLRVLADTDLSVLVTTIGRKSKIEDTNIHQHLQCELRDLSQIERIDADHFICALGSTMNQAGSKENFLAVDFQAVLDFAKLAERSNAKSLHIISALGADSASKVFYNRTKGEMQDAVSKINIPSIVFYQPSLLLGKRTEFRFGEKVAMLLSPIYSPLLKGSLKSFRPIPAISVAKAILSQLGHLKSGVTIVPNIDMLREN